MERCHRLARGVFTNQKDRILLAFFWASTKVKYKENILNKLIKKINLYVPKLKNKIIAS